MNHEGVLDTPPRIPTIPTKFLVEFGQIGWNLVGMDFQWESSQISFLAQTHSYQIPTIPTKFQAEW